MISDERIEEIEFHIRDACYTTYIQELLAERKQLVAIAEAVGNNLNIRCTGYNSCREGRCIYCNLYKPYRAWRKSGGKEVEQ